MDESSGFEFIVLTPAGLPEPSLAIAGSRAGALGVLNLEHNPDFATAQASLEAIEQHAHAPYGILVDAAEDALLDALLADAAPGLTTVILTNLEPESAAGTIGRVHAAGLRPLAVVTSLKEALAAQAAGADGLIARGHESGGWVGEETAFVLLQHLSGRVDLPVWVQGGIGPHTAAACFVGGAAGAVLDSQLLLTRESPLSARARSRIENMDGSETITVGAGLNATFRAYFRPDLTVIEELRQLEASEELTRLEPAAARRQWREKIRSYVDWQQENGLWAIGQDAAFAADLARRYVTVGGVIAALRASVRDHADVAREAQPLGPDAPLAASHGTTYPIVQGPMTRVSDRAAFADAVSRKGALPFLALALMRKDDIDSLLKETQALLGKRSWGVGILAFVPPALRAEQLEVVRAYKPPFALLAGGRPDQARVLEADGITTYLHVPSPGLLRMFLGDEARRFVFEGRECGGHVGPRTSFVLWETMVTVLLEYLDARPGAASEFHVLFAGGVHDSLSAAMVAAIAAPLVERGVRIGVLIGTAYLFTEEAVSAGAIKQDFQQAAVDCAETVLLEAAPGYATRCLPSPFADTFAEEKRNLLRAGASSEEIRERLEELNIGRLRIASKGVDHNPLYGRDPAAPRLVEVAEAERWTQGMYMIGQVAALHDRTCTMAELHRDVAVGSSARLREAAAMDKQDDAGAPPPAAVAIVGMSTILPGAPDLDTFWANVLNKVNALQEVPPERWDPQHYFDADKAAPDKVYSRWGGFIDDVPFDPLQFGIPPSSLKSIEPFQLLGLAMVQAALKDAGYLERPFNRERTSVILGAGGGGPDMTAGLMFRSMLPAMFGDAASEITDRIGDALPEWTEDSFPGLLMNVAAGRIANRFDFGGVNYTVDAACASSLAAVYLGVRDLENRTSDVVIVGGVEAIQNPFGFLCFSKTQALSPSGQPRPFDAESDGIAISEGFAAVMLKRLEDAERDGDRIYAVIRGVGGSSDGKARSLTAPRPAGQVRALRRAYAQARFSPATVGLVEAHGTGTVAGDQAEAESLSTFFGESGAAPQSTALGSVKSMIGHTKATAGVAGLVKVSKSLHHKVLPPTLGVTEPNPKANFDASPLYVNSEPRPWVQAADGAPRRAGVSAFGFGGTNFHVVLEEYTGSYLPQVTPGLDAWPAELLVWRGPSRAEILQGVRDIATKLANGARPRLADLAYTLALRAQNAPPQQPALAIVAESLEQLVELLDQAQALLERNTPTIHGPQGIHFAEAPLAPEGRIAFLFPGQGSQYINMVRDLALVFPEVRAAFDAADAALAGRLPAPLSRYIFPPPAFKDEVAKQQQAALTETDVAQPALGAAGLALLQLLHELGIEPAMTAGHSYGEFLALHVAGCFSAETMLQLSEARGRFMRENASEDSGTMAAVSAAPEALAPLLAEGKITLANLNSPRQTVISGPTAEIEQAVEWCKAHQTGARQLVVACAFHSPLVAPAQQKLAALLAETQVSPPQLPVYSNTTGTAYPDDVAQLTSILAGHLARPVEFVREIESMYEDGARIFLEVGPRQVLTGLVGQILGERPFLTANLDNPNRNGVVQLLHATASLLSEGVSLRTDRLFRGRNVRRLDLTKLEQETGTPAYSPTTWLVNGGGVRPVGTPARKPFEPLKIHFSEPSTSRNGASAAKIEIHPASANGASANGTNGMHPVAPRPAIEMVAANGSHSASQQPVTPMAVNDVTLRPVNMPAPSTEKGASFMSEPQPQYPMQGGGDVLQHFQQVMQQFLQVQESVMLGWLGTQPVAPVAPPVEAWQTPSVAPAPIAAPVQPAPVYTNGAPAAHAHAATPPAPAPVVSAVPAPVAPPPAAPASVANAKTVLTREKVSSELLAIVSDRTGYPPETLGLDADLEADLGIDSIKRVEIAGAVLRQLSEYFGEQPEVERLTTSRTLAEIISQVEALAAGERAPAAASASPPPTPAAPVEVSKPVLTREKVTSELLSIVSDRTGYPPETLGLDADLEADLGIDSIKRVEIAGAVLRQLSEYFGEQPEVERLTTSRTLAEIISQVEALAAGERAPAAASASPPPTPAAPVEVSKPVLTREKVTSELLTIVSDRTGYPPETLGLDADLEADLGIDSIKRVEIAGAVLRQLSEYFGEQPEVEKLTTSRTLAEIISQVEALAGEASGKAPASFLAQPV